jgi:hypothetical protein
MNWLEYEIVALHFTALAMTNNEKSTLTLLYKRRE